MTKPPVLRCAVYTRKSSEEGLEQEYNSLHAQRDACEAYIKSQVSEGWTCLKTAYDDGGISGGTMDRPGLKQLLADIAARRIDVVVVYKVDRLTRSLWDFAKIVEVFDKHQVSFVSVTQSFNTTSSMGRLTLNMLLSFAQFEREVTSERIRDKIAASKARGMWMGGGVPLGYVAEGRTLKIDEAEAETVRYIFRRYLDVKSVHRLKAVLDAEGVRSKLSVFSTGRTRGGCAMDRGALFKLLSNPAYLGKVKHKDKSYEGLHPAIIDQATFDAVGLILEANRVKRTTGSARRTQSALMGKLFDEEGNAMTPTFANGRGGKRYRYYVSAALQVGRATAKDDSIRRLPGPPMDRLVEELVGRLASADNASFTSATLKPGGIELAFSRPAAMEPSEWRHALSVISTRLTEGERAWSDRGGAMRVFCPCSVTFRGGRCRIEGQSGLAPRKIDNAMTSALQRAHSSLAAIGLPLSGRAEWTGTAMANSYERRLAELAFLAPDIQQAIVEGRQPRSLSLTQLQAAEIPAGWDAQRRAFGFEPA
jgi:site-specific DNA recombinase